MNSDINLNGNWDFYKSNLKIGWMCPCYFCNTLTGRTLNHDNYTLWTCKNCTPSYIKNNKKNIEKLILIILKNRKI